MDVKEDQIDLLDNKKKPKKKNAKRKFKGRAIGDSPLSKLSLHSTNSDNGGQQISIKLTRNEINMLERIVLELQETHYKTNRSRVMRAFVHMLEGSDDLKDQTIEAMRTYM